MFWYSRFYLVAFVLSVFQITAIPGFMPGAVSQIRKEL